MERLFVVLTFWNVKQRLRARYLMSGLMAAVAACLALGCKPPSKEPTKEVVREQSSEEALPTMDPSVRDPEAAAARELLRPEARLPGTVAIVLARSPSCLGLRVHEKFVLTAASCVMEIFSSRPRPGYLYGITFDLAWKVGNDQRVAPVTAAAVYPHPSFLEHFSASARDKRGLWTDTKALAQVADLALVEISTKGDLTSLPVVSLAEALPPVVVASGPVRPEIFALHGYCGAAPPLPDAQKAQGNTEERLFLAGGRQVNVVAKAGERRGYFLDRFPVPRALFDCEAFLGAPVILAKGAKGQPELLGLTSWMRPGSSERGLTWTVGKDKDPNSIAGWIAARVAKARDFVPPKLDSTIGCEHEVTSALGKIAVSIPSWRVGLEAGKVVATFPIFDLSLRLSAPAPDASIEGIPPLISKGQPNQERKTRMLRDVREAEYVRYVGESKWKFAGQDVSVSFLSTDGKTGLVTIAAYEPASKKERTVNVYLEEFASGPYCRVASAAK